MKHVLVLALLCGCLQIQFDQPLNVIVESQTEVGEFVTSQSFACNIDVKLIATIHNGTVDLALTDGISILHQGTYTDDVQFSGHYERAAPIEVTLTRTDFNGTLSLEVACS